MALACTWNGYAQTGFEFSKLFSNNHTIAIRFLMQYPNGYAGAFFSVFGTGKYFVGQGDFQALQITPPEGETRPSRPGETNLLIRIGDEVQRYPYAIASQGWHHVALVRTGNQMQVYIDGLVKTPFQIPNNVLPQGRLRFGHSDFRPGKHDRGGQFYGLLDDFALFNTDLTAQEVKKLSDAKRLTDVERLIGHDSFKLGYVFRNLRPTSLPARLRGSLEINSPATFVEVSDLRDATLDLPKIPLPLNSHMHLPFAPGDVWSVIQGYNDANGSHKGFAAFCWDFGRTGVKSSEGEMIYSASSGRVRHVIDCLSTGSEIPSYVAVIKERDESFDYLHIQKDSALVSRGDHVSFGTPVAHVGDVGVAAGAYHLHFGVSNGDVKNSDLVSTNCIDMFEPEGPNYFTLPAAFSNYEAEIDGEWKLMIRGIPEPGQRIRRPTDEGPIRYTAVWERRTDPEIQMYGVTYEQYRAKYDSIWNNNWRLALLETVGVNDHARYTAVWRLTGGSEFQLYGATKAELDAENDKRQRDGWRIDLLTSYVVNGQARYTGVWRPSNQARPMILGETLNTLKARHRVMRDQGFCLHRLSTHSNGVEMRFSAIWRLGNEDKEPFFELTEHDYRADYGTQLESGFRVKLLSIAVVNGEPKYSGVYVKVKQAKPNDEERWHAVSYGDLRARYDVLWQQGWRLRILEPYVP